MCGTNFSSIQGETNPKFPPRGTQIHTPGNSDLYPGGLNFPHGETILHPGGFNFNPREDIKGFLCYRALLFASQFSGIVLNPNLGKDLKPRPVCKNWELLNSFADSSNKISILQNFPAYCTIQNRTQS